MTTATVTRTKTPHPTLLAASIGALCVAFGLLLGIAIGTRLAPAATTSASVMTSTGLTMPSGRTYVLPASAPGNPYVNIHVAGEIRTRARLPIAAPGNPRVTIPAATPSPTSYAGAGLEEQRLGERHGAIGTDRTGTPSRLQDLPSSGYVNALPGQVRASRAS